MSGTLKSPHVSEADYLSAELIRLGKHEFVCGQVFAMPDVSNRHNQIAVNVAIALRKTAPNTCRVSISDVKFKANQLYYYPDVMVSCAPKSDEYCESQPCLIVEVLSESTESIDRGEKLHNYQKAPELEAYLLVSEKECRVDVFKRSGAFWGFESVTDGEIALSCPAMSLALDAIYQGVEVDANEALRVGYGAKISDRPHQQTKMRIEGVITEKEYIAAQYLHLRPKRIFSIIGLIIFVFFLASLIDTPSVYSFGALIYLVGYFLYLYWYSKKTFRQYKAILESFSIELRENGLYFERKNGKGLIPWGEIFKWKRSDKLILLYPTSNLFYVIPRSVFDSQGDYLEFQEELKRRIGNAI